MPLTSSSPYATQQTNKKEITHLLNTSQGTLSASATTATTDTDLGQPWCESSSPPTTQLNTCEEAGKGAEKALRQLKPSFQLQEVEAERASQMVAQDSSQQNLDCREILQDEEYV